MENKILRRMNLSSFLMVPVQRITKYPLLLARLLKVNMVHLTPILLSQNQPYSLFDPQAHIPLAAETPPPFFLVLLMAAPHKVTPGHHADRENIREAQTRIEVIRTFKI